MIERKVFWGDWCALLPASSDVRAMPPEGEGKDAWDCLDQGLWVPAGMMFVTVPVRDRKTKTVQLKDFKLRLGGELDAEVASALPDAAELDSALRATARTFKSACREALSFARPKTVKRLGTDAEALAAPLLPGTATRDPILKRARHRTLVEQLRNLRERRLQPLPTREEPCKRLLNLLNRHKWPARLHLSFTHSPDGRIVDIVARQPADLVGLTSNFLLRSDGKGLEITPPDNPHEVVDDLIGALAVHLALAVEESGLFPVASPLTIRLALGDYRRRILRFHAGTSRFNLLLLSSGEDAAGDPDLKGMPPDIDPVDL